MTDQDPFEFGADTPIAEALELDPRVERVFRDLGLRCPGRKPGAEWCVAADRERLKHAALYHEIDLERLLQALNALKVPRKAGPEGGASLPFGSGDPGPAPESGDAAGGEQH